MSTEEEQLKNALIDLHKSNLDELKATLAKLENSFSSQEKDIASLDRSLWKIQNYGYSFVGLVVAAAALFGYSTWQSIPSKVKIAINDTAQVFALNSLTEKLEGVDAEATTILARLKASERDQVVPFGPIAACSGRQEVFLPEGEFADDFVLLVVPTDMNAEVESRQNGDNAVYGSSVSVLSNNSNTGWTVEYKLLITKGSNAGLADCRSETTDRFGKASVVALRR